VEWPREDLARAERELGQQVELTRPREIEQPLISPERDQDQGFDVDD